MDVVLHRFDPDALQAAVNAALRAFVEAMRRALAACVEVVRDNLPYFLSLFPQHPGVPGGAARVLRRRQAFLAEHGRRINR